MDTPGGRAIRALGNPRTIWVLVLSSALGCAPGSAETDGGIRSPDGGSLDAVVQDDAVPGAHDAESGVTLDGAVGDGAASDASVGDDAGPLRPSFPDLAIGPYRQLLPMLLASIEANCAALDTSASYGHSAAQGYVLQAIGELLWAAREYDLPERDRLITLALAEIEELRAASGRTTGAAPAFGLDTAWDAFGDGTTNPAFTAYTWQSGMVALGVASVARALVTLDHPSAASVRDFGVALVERWSAHHTDVGGVGGYWWYSTEPSDAIAVHNTSALIAMSSQLLSEHGGPASLGIGPRGAADLLWARMSGNPTIGYTWNYADDGYPTSLRRAEDISHALVTLQLMRFANERSWWTTSQMQGVSATLLRTVWSGNPARLAGLVDGSRTGAEEWNDTRAAVIGFAAHGDSPGGDPRVFDLARSIFFSSYLARYDRPLTGATVDAVRTLALALLLSRRPAAFASGSRWEREAGPGDDAVPTTPGGTRFYTVDWAPPAPLTAGITLPARLSTSASANLLVDLEDGTTGRVIVSLTYRSGVDTTLASWNGTVYQTLANLPATLDEAGTPRWFRTTICLPQTR